ncbi:Delta3-Delta2-enoyl-CoA isomerase [Paragonimus westermani]|uniref:Delta3-Delta2-enoyl-CoA isomerase n=1 Tax=Paragonimus westermani TaxID=34504 RepID=A0A5J4NJP0_9TREM|nr:Delta3-Delta2-enoyl-CoA isomerase [Paragonimus westermani]
MTLPHKLSVPPMGNPPACYVHRRCKRQTFPTMLFLLRCSRHMSQQTSTVYQLDYPACGILRTFHSLSFRKCEPAVKPRLDKEVQPISCALLKQAALCDCTTMTHGSSGLIRKVECTTLSSLSRVLKDKASSAYFTLINHLSNQLNTRSSSSVQPDLPFKQTSGLTCTLADNGVLRILFNRPEKKNALTIEIYETMISILEQATYNPQVNLVTVSGLGDFFSSGNDFSIFEQTVRDGGNLQDVSVQLLRTVQRFVDALIAFPKILIALVNGPAIGIPVTTLALYDYVIASDKVYFQTPFTQLGVAPEGCSSYTFPLVMGSTKVSFNFSNFAANEILLFNHRLSVNEALSRGLVNVIYKEKFFTEQCNLFIRELSELPAEVIPLSFLTLVVTLFLCLP